MVVQDPAGKEKKSNSLLTVETCSQLLSASNTRKPTRTKDLGWVFDLEKAYAKINDHYEVNKVL